VFYVKPVFFLAHSGLLASLAIGGAFFFSRYFSGCLKLLCSALLHVFQLHSMSFSQTVSASCTQFEKKR
jgi:hypothetical protein